MTDKTFKQLSTREKFKLQKIVNKYRKGNLLTEEENQWYQLYISDYIRVERQSKAKRPIIILSIITCLLVMLRHCTH